MAPHCAALQVLLEIQDTLKQPPQAAKTMKKAMSVAITAAFAFYLSVAVTGYSALGLNESTMPPEVLEGFKGERAASQPGSLRMLPDPRGPSLPADALWHPA